MKASGKIGSVRVYVSDSVEQRFETDIHNYKNAFKLSSTQFRDIAVLDWICRELPVNRGADKSLARPGRKQARKHVRDAHDFNNIETWAVTKFFFPPLKGKVPKEIHAILTNISFFPSWWG